jgi:HAD superfamily hydrolase (TIGR01509 family)
MDGLLVDSEPLWLEAETAVMARLGAAWTPADQVQLLGGSLDRTVRYLMSKATRPAAPGQIAEWLMSGVTERVRDHGIPLRPGARELLAEVGAAGLPHALVTSSERGFMDAALARTGLRFDALVCADDVSVTKPDPEPYLLAAKLLGTDPGRCTALEDSPNGVASAEAAGCRVIAVPSLVPIDPAPGRTVVRSLLDLRADASGISVRVQPPVSSLRPARRRPGSRRPVRMRGERRPGGSRGDTERDLGGCGASLHGHRDVGAAGGRRRVGGDEQHLGGDPDRHDRARDGNRSRDLVRIVNPPVSEHLLLVGGLGVELGVSARPGL